MTDQDPESSNENIHKAEQLARIDQLVGDMHHRLFGNGQPGIVTVYNNRITDLEADRNKFMGAIKLVRMIAVLLPLLVAAGEGYRVWSQAQPSLPPVIVSPAVRVSGK